MFDYLYKHWAAMCLPIAIYVTLLLGVNLPTIGWPLFLIWLQFPVYLIHQFEEHAYPGGFKNYINTRVFHSTINDCPLTDANVFWINIPVIWFLFPLAATLAQLCDIKYGILLPMFGMFNATTHMIVAIIKREYNPGLFVSTLLNYPTGILTFYFFNQNQQLDWPSLSTAFIVTFIIHLILIIFAKRKAKKITAA